MLSEEGVNWDALWANARAMVVPILVLIFLWIVYVYFLPGLPHILWDTYVSSADLIGIGIEFVALITCIVLLGRFKRLVDSGSSYVVVLLGITWLSVIVKCVGYILAVTIGFYIVNYTAIHVMDIIRVSRDVVAYSNTAISLTAVAVGMYVIAKVLLGGIPAIPRPISKPLSSEARLQDLQKLVEKLDEKLALGEISEDLYKELKCKYENRIKDLQRETKKKQSQKQKTNKQPNIAEG